MLAQVEIRDSLNKARLFTDGTLVRLMVIHACLVWMAHFITMPSVSANIVSFTASCVIHVGYTIAMIICHFFARIEIQKNTYEGYSSSSTINGILGLIVFIASSIDLVFVGRLFIDYGYSKGSDDEERVALIYLWFYQILAGFACAATLRFRAFMDDLDAAFLAPAQAREPTKFFVAAQ